MSVIANTTVLTNFAAIGQLDLLRQLFSQLYVTSDVYDEVRQGAEEGYSFFADFERYMNPPASDGWILLTPLSAEELRTMRQFPAKLHRGETSCLAVAHHRQWRFVSDDQSARRMADTMRVKFTGTIGCLVLAVTQHVCSLEKANQYLRQMIESGYYSPVTDLRPLVEQAKG